MAASRGAIIPAASISVRTAFTKFTPINHTRDIGGGKATLFSHHFSTLSCSSDRNMPMGPTDFTSQANIVGPSCWRLTRFVG